MPRACQHHRVSNSTAERTFPQWKLQFSGSLYSLLGILKHVQVLLLSVCYFKKKIGRHMPRRLRTVTGSQFKFKALLMSTVAWNGLLLARLTIHPSCSPVMHLGRPVLGFAVTLPSVACRLIHFLTVFLPTPASATILRIGLLLSYKVTMCLRTNTAAGESAFPGMSEKEHKNIRQ